MTKFMKQDREERNTDPDEQTGDAVATKETLAEERHDDPEERVHAHGEPEDAEPDIVGSGLVGAEQNSPHLHKHQRELLKDLRS